MIGSYTAVRKLGHQAPAAPTHHVPASQGGHVSSNTDDELNDIVRAIRKVYLGLELG